jgi:hypothetical protein
VTSAREEALSSSVPRQSLSKRVGKVEQERTFACYNSIAEDVGRRRPALVRSFVPYELGYREEGLQ